MKLVIGEYLRSLRERDELDRLLPDLIVEMGYVPIALPQTGNRQFGVDIAARGKNIEDSSDEILLLVVKQRDIGRTEWDSGPQSIRQSITEIFDVYLRSHLEPEDVGRPIRIVVVTNGELKQTVLPNWAGLLAEYQGRAVIEFWGASKLSELVERHLFDEFVFRDEDRKQLRRALALSGDADYDRSDLHQLYLRQLGLTREGSLVAQAMTEKELIKALGVVNLSAQIFASWSWKDGDARQGLRGMERALLWSWHRLQLEDDLTNSTKIISAFYSLWLGYERTARRYFEKMQKHCHVKDGLFQHYSSGIEFSLVAFEQLGILSSIGLSMVLRHIRDEEITAALHKNARVVANTVAHAIKNNDILSSPCLDRHCSDISMALILLINMGFVDQAREWVIQLVNKINYAYVFKQYVPLANDSIEDLVESGSGWNGGNTETRLMCMSWTLPTLAGWCVILKLDEEYKQLAEGSIASYPEVYKQLWHPDNKYYGHLYFQQAHYLCGTSEVPLVLPAESASWLAHMGVVSASGQEEIARSSPAGQAGFLALDLIASRHFETPITPHFWYRFAAAKTETEKILADETVGE